MLPGASCAGRTHLKEKLLSLAQRAMNNLGRTLRILSACASFLLLMGHNLLPHQHDVNRAGLCRLAAVTERSLLELLKVSLSIDLGSDHLRYFCAHQDAGTAEDGGPVPVACIPVDWAEQNPSEADMASAQVPHRFAGEFCGMPPGLRAPPAFV
jgi:hypothetical protein